MSIPQATADISALRPLGDSPHIRDQNLLWAQHRPSWLLPTGETEGVGRASLRLTTCPPLPEGGGWLTIEMSEFAIASRASKRTILTLRQEEIVALRDACNRALGETSTQEKLT